MKNYYITPKLRLLFTEDIEKDSQLAMNFEEDWERIQKMDSLEYVEWLNSATPEAITNYKNYGDYKLKYNNFSSKFKRLVKRVKRIYLEKWTFWLAITFISIFIFSMGVWSTDSLLIGFGIIYFSFMLLVGLLFV